MFWHGAVLLQAVSKWGKAMAPLCCLMRVIHCALSLHPPLDTCRTAEAIAEFVTERSGLPVGKIERTPLISAR